MSRDELDTLLAGLRDHDADPPPFDRVWRAALARRDARRPRRRLAHAATALAAVAALVFVLMPAPEPADELAPEALELARSLSEWQAPLDFLLEPPGGSLVGLDPSSPALDVLDELSLVEMEEII